MQNTRDSAEAVAKALGISSGEVLIESTGVIGRQLKMEALLQGVPVLADSLAADVESAQHAAVGITTTDLVSKSAAIEVAPPPPPFYCFVHVSYLNTLAALSASMLECEFVI